MLGRLFGKSTLEQDLTRYIKGVVGKAQPDGCDVSGHGLKVLIKHGYLDNDLSLALKLRDDIQGKDVIYTDSDFIRCRNTHRTNPVGRMLAKHRDSLPPTYIAQRATVTDAHLDGVMNDTEQEQNYGGSNAYRPPL